MTLVTRVSVFFLASLAVILAGFSAILYFIVAGYLDRQTDQRLDAAVAALVAAVEVKPDCVEWDPKERRLELGDFGVRWLVRDPEGHIIGASSERFPDVVLDNPQAPIDAAGDPWRVSQIQVNPGHPVREPQPDETPKDQTNEPGIYPSLLLTVAAPLGPIQSSIRRLLWTLIGVSAAVWAVAALVGRQVCRRTLLPVVRMAESARSMQVLESDKRLRVEHTRDELEELGKAFNGVLDRLQAAFERERRFAGEASHQLRTPLAIMLGQIEVALRRERPSDEYRRVLTVVAEQGQRLHRLVEMLLILARTNAEAALPDPSALCMRSWLEAHLQEWATHPRSPDIRLVSPTDGAVHARVYPPLLGQVVDALLENACKYSRPNTPVTLSLQAEAERVLLVVQDAGCGIAPDEAPRVFDPFFRSSRLGGDSASSGVGLGLAIARRATTAMGGDIQVESELGRGSRFTVQLMRG